MIETFIIFAQNFNHKLNLLLWEKSLLQEKNMLKK